nr:ADP-ribosylation factor GTPase-activating protein 3-like isoform X1 [Mirounga angustirostris]
MRNAFASPQISLTYSAWIFCLFSFCVLRTLKIHTCSKFQVYNAVLFTIVTVLYFPSPELTHLVNGSLCPLNICPFPLPPSPWETLFYSLFLSTARRKADYEPVENTDEAQKKFGNVKAISSDMYFGRQAQADYETRARLERLSASSSISSADLFDEQRKQTAGSYSLTSVLPTAPDMAQFKQGVRSVAGKLSVFANGVMTSIQDRYGS